MTSAASAGMPRTSRPSTAVAPASSSSADTTEGLQQRVHLSGVGQQIRGRPALSPGSIVLRGRRYSPAAMRSNSIVCSVSPPRRSVNHLNRGPGHNRACAGAPTRMSMPLSCRCVASAPAPWPAPSPPGRRSGRPTCPARDRPDRLVRRLREARHPPAGASRHGKARGCPVRRLPRPAPA